MKRLIAAAAAVLVAAAACTPLKPPEPDPTGLTIEPASAALTHPAGTDPASVELVVTNAGDDATGPLTVALSTTGPGEFDIPLNNCEGTTLAPDAQCFLTARYRNDTGAGTSEATITVSADPGGTATASLTGEGLPPTPPELAIDPTTAALTDAPGQTGDTVFFSVTNLGSQPTGILTVAISGGGVGAFEIASGSCLGGASLGPEGQCDLLVRYSNDTGGGTGTGTVTVSAAPGGSAAASLTGEGLPGTGAPALALEPASATLTDTVGGFPAVQAFTLTNSGSGVSGTLMVSIANATGFGTFTVVGADACVALGPGASCSFAVQYLNQFGTGSSASAELRADGSTGESAVAQLSGIGQD